MGDQYGGISVICITERKKHKGFLYLRKNEFVFCYSLYSNIIPFDVKTFDLQKEIVQAPGFLSLKRKKAFSVKTSNLETTVIIPLEESGFEDINQQILKMRADLFQAEENLLKDQEKDGEILLEIRNAARDMRNSLRHQLNREAISDQPSPVQNQPQKFEGQQFKGKPFPTAEVLTTSSNSQHVPTHKIQQEALLYRPVSLEYQQRKKLMIQQIIGCLVHRADELAEEERRKESSTIFTLKQKQQEASVYTSYSDFHNIARYSTEDWFDNDKIYEVKRIIYILDQRRNELLIQTQLLIKKGFAQHDAEKLAPIVLNSNRQRSQKLYIYNTLRHIYGHTMGSSLYHKLGDALRL